MSKKECIAMLLAGGQGSRLGVLTQTVAKPAVSFGGKYRIIDFALSNCTNSGIDTVGVLTQYRPYSLHSYIGSGAAWNLDAQDGGISILPPYSTQTGGNWYEGTADAVFQNLEYIESFDPSYVLILSGDQLYRMDYNAMLEEHKANEADLTVAVMPVAWEEASRFGIITKADDGRIAKFTEKPPEPDSNLASMGIYIFTKELLIESLKADANDKTSDHDFGKDIIPKLLAEGKNLYCHEFRGYWRDVGTIASYHATSMELLGSDPAFDLFEHKYDFFSNPATRPPHYVGPEGSVVDSYVANGCRVMGTVRHSIISIDAVVDEGATVVDSVLLPGAHVCAGASVSRAILGEGATVGSGVAFGSVDTSRDIAIVGENVVVGRGE